MNTVKITFGDNLVVCFNGMEYPLGVITELSVVSKNVLTEKIWNSDGTSTLRPVMETSKLEFTCSQPVRMENER